ncbi:hypothetical protein [Croceicoccus sp. YJ47]|uniref:hypothetical protein n=1 Tax=Croceicoccus sp. YJ47 TaxID=2798724 RepID=UPI001923FE54|nr:hypothetical protein [Croceicoccus sp. YJ47]QQN74417.1 hypothetical protein JD971_01040 [Croceicoccus sp. YJ47]
MTNMLPMDPVSEAFERDCFTGLWTDLYDELVEDYEPKGLIQRLYLRDIAKLTGRIEQLRLIQSGLHSYHLYALSCHAKNGRTASDDAAIEGSSWCTDVEERGVVHNIVASLENISLCNLNAFGPAFERLVGMAYTQRHALFIELDRLIVELVQARNAVINGLDARCAQLDRVADLEGMLQAHLREHGCGSHSDDEGYDCAGSERAHRGGARGD